MTISANFPNVQPSLLLDFANAKQLPPQVNFTRATTATYYDGNTTAKAEQNFFFYSQDFSQAAWGVNGATKTSTTQTDPAGGSTALLLTKVTDDGYSLRQYSGGPNPAGKTFTYSVYLKGASAGSLRLFVDNGVDQSFISDISITTSWVRYTLTTGAFNNTTAYLTAGVALVAGSVTSVNVAFAQIEERSSATAYTATTTQPITNYIPVLLTAGGGQPRFDHNPTTSESLGLLIEESRTNLFSYSSQFDDAYWAKANCSITANANVAPDGTLSADLATATSGLEEIYRNTTKAASAITYTLSIYVKPYSGVTNSFVLYLSDNSTGQATGSYDFSSVTASATNGTWANSSATITSVGNGWFRCTLTSTSPANTGLLPGFTWGSTSGQAVFLWGAQIETGSFPTSYIPTTSAAATRAADAASMTGSNFTSWFNNSEGTTYAETSTIGGTNSSQYLGVYKFGDGTITNRFGLYGRPLAAGYGAVMTTNGTTVAGLEPISGSTSTTVNTYSRLAYSYKVNEFSATRNASTVTTDTAGGVAAVNKLEIGIYDDVLNGYIKKLAYYPIAVTSAQLQALTS